VVQQYGNQNVGGATPKYNRISASAASITSLDYFQTYNREVGF